MWNRFVGEVRGTLVKGDPLIPETRWRNFLYFHLVGLDKVTVFCIIPKTTTEVLPYRIGYKPTTTKGRALICDRFLTNRHAAVWTRHEDCIYFAIDTDGNEVPLVFDREMHRENVSMNIPVL